MAANCRTKFATPTGIELRELAENVFFLPAGPTPEPSVSGTTKVHQVGESPSQRSSSVNAGPPQNPRASALADLYRHAAELAAAGDLEGAKAVHESIGRLLGKAGENAPIVDLAARRAKR